MNKSGWYPDPFEDGFMRYWDGMGWTGRTTPVDESGQPFGMTQRWSEFEGAVKVVLVVIAAAVLAFIVFYLIDTFLSSRSLTTDQAGAIVARSCYDAGHDLGTSSFETCVERSVSMGETSGLNDTYGMVSPDGDEVYGSERSDLITEAAMRWRP